MTELERQIAETKIECMKDFKTELLLMLSSDDRTSIYENFIKHVDTITGAIIQEEKERLGL